MTQATSRPEPSEYASFYAGYIARVGDDPIMTVLKRQNDQRSALLRTIAEERETHRYAEGKWSIRELVGHLADAERVFGYRALCISRGEKTSLPGFDENSYIAASPFNEIRLTDLTRELDHLRQANIALFGGLRDEQWTRSGVANNSEITVRALAYIIAGHEAHHLETLQKRYLDSSDSSMKPKPVDTSVRGIGGIFFKSHDPKTLSAWYRDRLGVAIEDFGGAMFRWRDVDNPSSVGYTVWSAFPETTKYFEPSTASFMVNFRVDDLHATLASLREAGANVDEKSEESEFGKFGWVMDPEGNRIELWEPPE